MDVEFEGVEERVGHGKGAIESCREAMADFERAFGFVAGGEGDVLEVAVGVCDLYVLLAWCLLRIRDLVREWNVICSYVLASVSV